MHPIPTPFNRSLLRLRRDRAAKDFADFLKREMAERLAERLDDITRSFPIALDLGCHRGEFAQALQGRGGIEMLIHADLSPAMVAHAPAPKLAASEELLPFAENSIDMIVSTMSLHWVNDLPGTLAQMQRILKPDGLLLLSFAGGDTLQELRAAALAAGVESGVSPRVSPFVDVRDAGALLQRTGFALPVVDSDPFIVSYESPWKLLQDLRAMGETNALFEQRKTATGRAEIARLVEYYQTHYADPEGRIPATFDILTLTAWKPHASQQQPSKRGSGTVSLRDVL